MSNVLWIVVSLVAYIGGLIAIVRVTPQLLSRSFDEFGFMWVAALDILGAILALGAVVMILSISNGAPPGKILNFLLLIGVIVVAVRTSLSSFRPHVLAGTFRVSRILAGSFCLLLAAAAVFYIVQLFATSDH